MKAVFIYVNSKLNSVSYMKIIQDIFLSSLDEMDVEDVWFQHYKATALTVRTHKAFLPEVSIQTNFICSASNSSSHEFYKGISEKEFDPNDFREESI